MHPARPSSTSLCPKVKYRLLTQKRKGAEKNKNWCQRSAEEGLAGVPIFSSKFKGQADGRTMSALTDMFF